MTAARPTILQIIPELSTGGAELSTVEIAEAIVKAGGRAIVLSEGGRLAERLAASGGELIAFPAASKNPATILANIAKIARIVEAENVDLIHARSRAPAWSALRAARTAGKPFVTTYHGAYKEQNAAKKFYNSVMAKGDVVIANSGYTAKLIQSRYGTPDRRLTIIHRGVDGGAFDPGKISTARTDDLRSAWGIDPNARIVLHAARLSGWKGQSVVIAAARQLRDAGKLGDAVFILAGDAQGRDDYRSALLQQIRDAGLSDAVRLVGHVDDIPAAMKLAHVAVVASTEPEAFGRAATEAQIMGCPVIATNIGAPPETVLGQDAATRTGWLVAPGDAAALAAALAEGLSLPAKERLAIRTRARAHVLANFTLHAMRAKTLAVYDRLLGTHMHDSYVAADPQP